MFKDNPLSLRFLELPIYALVSVPLVLFCIWLSKPIRFYLFKEPPPIVTIEIEDSYPISHLDAYCNGVYLGNTPLRISREDFLAKVPQWDKPPRQERIETRFPIPETAIAIPEDSIGGIRLSYTPHNQIKLCSYYKIANALSRRHRIPIWEQMQSGQYWFQFKKEGCLVGSSPAMSGFGMSGSEREMTNSFLPDVIVFSQEEHLRHVLFALRQSDYQPSEEWIHHVCKYEDLLFNSLVEKAKTEKQFLPIIDALVRSEFHLPDVMTGADYRRVVDEVLDRAENRSSFSVPSLDSYAMDLAAPKIPDYISQQYKRVIGLPSYSSRFHGVNRDKFPRYYGRRGKAARQLPLEYAIKRYHPPQIFNRLVFEYVKRKYPEPVMLLIANYPGWLSRRLFQDFLDRISKDPSRPLFNFQEIHNPDLDSWIQQFFLDYRQPGFEYYLRSYIESLIDNSKTDYKKLIDLLLIDTNDPTQILEVLVQIHDPYAWKRAQSLVLNNDENHRTLLYNLGNRPNSYFEDFLLETYEIYKMEGRKNSDLDILVKDLYRINTEKTRALLLILWQDNQLDKKYLIQPLCGMDWFDPILSNWTEFLSQIDEPELRLRAIPALAKTESSQSIQVLQQWANNANEDVCNAARTVLREREKTLEQSKRLIAGESQPDDLLPAHHAYVWNGEEYVRESAPNRE